MKKRIHISLFCLILVLLLPLLTGCGTKESAPAGTELLQNGSLSSPDGNGIPEGWSVDAYVIEKAYTDYETVTLDGESCVHITNHYPNDARIAQTVTVEPDSYYCLHGYIRANTEGGLGANLSIGGIYSFSESVYDTNGEWQQITYWGRTDSERKSLTVFVRLGGYSGETTGEAWFKDISLIKYDAAPADQYIAEWYTESTAQSNTSTQSSEKNNGSILLISICAAWMLLCFLCMKKLAPGKAVSPLLAEGDASRKGIVVFLLLTIAGLALRLVIAALVWGYDVDINCFTSWTTTMQSAGPSGFYDQSGFCDYPPGYMLVLWLFSLGLTPTSFTVKLPSIVFDLLLVLLIYREARRKFGNRTGLILSALYLFNPFIILTGAAWGQSDAVMTGLLIMAVIFLCRGNLKCALPVYTLSVLMKPQALMFGPLGLLFVILYLISSLRERLGLKCENKKALLEVLIGTALSFVLLLLTSLLFQGSRGFFWMIELYANTMGGYAYTAVNACNPYFLCGLNWVPVTDNAETIAVVLVSLIFVIPCAIFMVHGLLNLRKNENTLSEKPAVTSVILPGCFISLLLVCLIVLKLAGVLTYSVLGTMMILLTLLLCSVLFFRTGKASSLPYYGAMMLIVLFNTGSMMHERYLFPAVGLLLIAYLQDKDKRILWLAAAVTLSGFLNTGCVLDRNIRIGGADGHLSAPLYNLVSDLALLEYISAVINTLCGMAAVMLGFVLTLPRKPQPVPAVSDAPAGSTPRESLPFRLLLTRRESKPFRLQKKDWLIMLGVTAAYSILAFVNLGSTKAPQTYYKTTSSNEEIIFDLGESRDFTLAFYSGIQHSSDHELTFSFSNDGENWGYSYTATVTEGDCFKWQSLLSGCIMNGRYVQLNTGYLPALWLNEVLCRDAETGDPIPMTLLSGPAGAESLCDEPDTLEGEPGSWWNSAYFDEIYHARTAYEHLHSLTPYETTHPPLGKVIMSWFVALFGMCPFGWRFAGALCGVLMLPAVYLLARLLIKRRRYAIGALLMMTFDLMHFAQTRLATIDSFVVLFILWSLCMMVYWLRQDHYGKKLGRTLIPLFLSGLFMGLSIASKWTGCYNGVALAILFFTGESMHMLQSRRAKAWLSTPEEQREDCVSEERLGAVKTAARESKKRHLITLGCCVIFFVIIPLVIYYLSYIPYFAYAQGGVSIQRIIEAAQGMLWYHSQPGLGMDHPFYSPWYEWPLNLKPMWLYSQAYAPAGMDATIMTFGNPAVWIAGLAGLIACAVIAVLSLCHSKQNSRPSLSIAQNTGADLHFTLSPFMLLIMFAAQFVPWTLVPRGTYIYHYFACVPIICLALMCVFDRTDSLLTRRIILSSPDSRERLVHNTGRKSLRIAFVIYIAVCIAMFIAFFPYVSGIMVPNAWLDGVKILQNWIWH